LGSETNEIAIGAAADLVVMEASLGSVLDTALDAISVGDFPGIALVITDGQFRVKGSLYTLRIADVQTG
jgi:enamidase